jgi:hypothetical protein
MYSPFVQTYYTGLVIPSYCTIFYLLYSLLQVSALNLDHTLGATYSCEGRKVS